MIAAERLAQIRALRDRGEATHAVADLLNHVADLDRALADARTEREVEWRALADKYKQERERAAACAVVLAELRQVLEAAANDEVGDDLVGVVRDVLKGADRAHMRAKDAIEDWNAMRAELEAARKVAADAMLIARRQDKAAAAASAEVERLSYQIDWHKARGLWSQTDRP